MRTLQKLIFGLVLAVGLSVVASAQRDDQKKPPPKERPPVVTPQPKPPPENKGKKPGEAAALWKREGNEA